MKRLLLLFCFLFGMIVCGYAQSRVKGCVTDENNNGLPYATVRLLDRDSVFVRGTATDSIGRFVLDGVEKGDYVLSFSSIGYQAKFLFVSIEEANHQLDKVVLQSDNVQLAEVEVKGRAFIRQKDKVLIIPDKQQVKHAGTGYDLLNNLMIPGIDVNRNTGSVTTVGGEATLYIDGNRASFREVQSLRPRDIEKVEYYDAPSGKYSNDVVSINYITRQYTSGGYVSLNAKQNIGYLNGDYNLVARLAKGHTKYTLYGGHGMTEYRGIHYEKQDYLLFPDYTVFRKQETIDGEVKNNQQYAQLKVINQTKKRSLMGNFSLVRSCSPDNYTDNQFTYQGYYNQSYTTHEQTDAKNLMPKMALMGQFHLPKDQLLEANLTGSYAQNDYTRNYVENDFVSWTDVKEKIYNLQGALNYTIKLKNEQTLSAQLSHNHQVSSSAYRGDYDMWSHLWTGETLFYVDYNGHIGNKFTYRLHPGFSYLQYRLHGEEAVNQFSPRLNIRGIYRIASSQQLSANLNIGNTFPHISTINNVVQKIDSLQVKRGNPNLDNADMYSAILSYNLQWGKVNIQADGYYTSFLHCTSDDYHIEDDKMVHSFMSDANFHQWEAGLSATWRVCDFWRIKADGGVGQFFLTRPIDEHRTSWYLSAQTSYYMGDFAVNVYASLAKRSLDFSGAYIHEPGNYGIMLSWNHKGWMIETGCDTPFAKRNEQVYRLNRDIYQYSQTRSSKMTQQTGYVKVAYTFDFGRKTSHVRDGVDKTINSAILK